MFSYGLSWQASLVTVWRVGECSGSAGQAWRCQVRQGRDWLGAARQGKVRQAWFGRAWFGMARRGEVRQDEVRQARRGGARRVVDRLGGAWHGYFLKIEEYKQEEIINGF